MLNVLLKHAAAAAGNALVTTQNRHRMLEHRFELCGAPVVYQTS